MSNNSSFPKNQYHHTWVKMTHWIGTIGFLLLLYSGIEILMVHPRLYWGNTGNDLMPALFELPISRNFKHGGWTPSQSFFNQVNSPITASRTYDIFNQNGWGRSLHFLAAWILVFAGLIYLMIAIFSGHIKKNIIPKLNELKFKSFVKEIKEHMRADMAYVKGPQYGLLQKTSYAIVLFVLVPIIVLTGLTMSPAITASYPFFFNYFLGRSICTYYTFFRSCFVIIVFTHSYCYDSKNRL